MQELYVSCITAAIIFPVLLFVTFVFRSSNEKDKAKRKENKYYPKNEDNNANLENGNNNNGTNNLESSEMQEQKESIIPEKEKCKWELLQDPRVLKYIRENTIISRSFDANDVELKDVGDDEFNILLGGISYNDGRKEENIVFRGNKAKQTEQKEHYFFKKNQFNKPLLVTAWIVTNLAIFLSAFFVILYSMEWGAKKANAWFISYMLSFIQNAFFADPMKVRRCFSFLREKHT